MPHRSYMLGNMETPRRVHMEECILAEMASDGDDGKNSSTTIHRRSAQPSQRGRHTAKAILAENGLAGFSIEAVARRAEAGKATIYRRWPAKTALLLNVYNLDDNTSALWETCKIGEDLFQFLKGLLDKRRVGGTCALFRPIVAEAQHDDSASQVLSDYFAARRRQNCAIIRRAQERGDIHDRADLELIDQTVWVSR